MINEQVRFTIAQQYFQAIENLADCSANPTLRNVVDFLHAFCRLTSFKDDAKFYSGKPFHRNFVDRGTGGNVWVYVFDQDDLPFLPEACIESLNLRKERVLCHYSHVPQHFLMLRTLPNYSLFFKGLLIAHEGFHAMTLAKSTTPPEHDAHEYATHCFIHDLLLETGGATYKHLLQQRVQQLKKELGGSSIDGHRSFGQFPYPPFLDEIWGTCRDANEAHSRRLLLNEHAVYCIIREMNVSRSEEARIASQF